MINNSKLTKGLIVKGRLFHRITGEFIVEGHFLVADVSPKVIQVNLVDYLQEDNSRTEIILKEMYTVGLNKGNNLTHNLEATEIASYAEAEVRVHWYEATNFEIHRQRDRFKKEEKEELLRSLEDKLESSEFMALKRLLEVE